MTSPALAKARFTLADTSKLLREADPGLKAADRTLELASQAVGPTLSLLRHVVAERMDALPIFQIERVGAEM